MKALATLLSLGLAAPSVAAPLKPEVVVSSPAVKSKNEEFSFRADFLRSQSRGAGPASIPTVGIGAGIAEGKPLEMALWGAGGAVAGSLAGPGGAIIGAATGVTLGLLYSVFIVPHNGPAPARAKR